MSKKMSPLLNIFKETFIEFCSSSAIHGVYYIVESGRRKSERLFWSCVVIFSLITTAQLIRHGVNVSSAFYTRAYIKSLHYPTYMASSPAFTFCTTIFLKSRAQELVNAFSIPYYFNKTEIMHDLTLLHFLEDTSEKNLNDSMFARIERLQSILNNNSVTVEQAIQKITQPCTELFVRCFAGSSVVNCSKLIFSTRSDRGFCCSMQYIPPPDIFNSSIQYIKKSSHNSFFNNYGFESGHAFVLNLSNGDHLTSRRPSFGARVFVHSKVQYPQLFSSGIFFSYGRETFIRLRVAVRKINYGLKQLNPNSRNCYFYGEVKLKYFTYYTFSNCITEARMDYIIKKCGCLPVTFPNNGNFSTCTLYDLKCLIMYQFSDVYGYGEDIYVKLHGIKHQCLHKCAATTYVVHATNGDFNAAQKNAFRLYDGLNTSGLTVVHIFKDSPTVWLHYRDATIYPWDYISVIGGILGISVGMHFFSIVEFLYYFVIRFSLKVSKMYFKDTDKIYDVN